MKNALLIVTVLFAAIMSTACINNFAVQELNNKAAEYLSKGDYDSANGRLEASLDIDPTIFETNYNLGVAYINAEKYEKAVEVLNKASSIKPEQSDIYYSLAVAQYNAAEDILEGKNEEIDDDEADEQPLVQDGQMSAKKEISIEDKQEAAKLYSDAIKSLEKYLTFTDIPADSKSSAESQLSTVQNKFSELQKQLPTEPNKEEKAPEGED